MRNLQIIACMVLVALLLATAGARSADAASVTPTLNSYLSAYVSNGTIANSTFYNESLDGGSYIIMQLQAHSGYVIVLNSSGTYTLVTNATTIDGVLTPFLISRYYPNETTINYLNSSMQSYKRYGYANISDCVVNTGLDSNNTCTFANNCFSCETVPNCHKVLESLGGVNSTFGLGLINFSIAYNRLNGSYNEYFKLLKTINGTNAGTVVSELSSEVSNISAVAPDFTDNPIFPPPQYIDFSTCSAATTIFNQPWYCTAVGFCSTVNFNSSQLSNIQDTLASIGTNLPSAGAITNISSNSSKLAQGYISTQLANKNGAAFAVLIASYYPQYNATIAKANTLLVKYNNITLNASIHVLETEFAAIQKSGVNQSIGVANTILMSLIANSTRIYSNASASYSQVYGIAQNNTASIMADQLSYQQVPSKLAVLGDLQQGINVELNSKVSSNDIDSIIPVVQSIRLESAVFVAPLTIGYMIKSLDGPFITAILGGSSATPPERIASAPIYATLASLIVGILVVLVIFVITYFRVMRKGKLKGNKRAQRQWGITFAVLIILVAIYAYATYAYASNANSNFLPFNYFLNTLKSSPTAYIALNGSAANNLSIGSCVTTVQKYLASAGKSVQVVKLTNYSCVSGSNISILGLNCYDNILNSAKPVVLITQSKEGSIVYKGLYGTVLYANGNIASGSSCVLGSLLKSV